MQKRRSVIIIAILTVAAIAVAGIVLAVNFSSDKTDSYRSIMVYELEGSAEIEREGLDVINAVENLYLESGDRIKTAVESFMRLKLDDDKYIMVEESSVLRLEATGNKVDSKTMIYLEQGAITNEIQNKLSDKSDYEVTTPNAVMAVRGTIFRVEVFFDENGDVYTKLSVFEGEVVSYLINPDGTKGEEMRIEAGKEVIIHSNQTITEYLSDPSDINYEDFSLQTLYILRDLMVNGSSIAGITQEELEKLIQDLERGEIPEPETEAETESETEPGQHTITFMYRGQVFGTQLVEDGQKAMPPKLTPAAEGEWDFDFSKTIDKDLTIEWKL